LQNCVVTLTCSHTVCDKPSKFEQDNEKVLMLRYWEKKPLHLKRSAPKYYEAWVRVRKTRVGLFMVFIRFHTSWGDRKLWKFQHFAMMRPTTPQGLFAKSDLDQELRRGKAPKSEPIKEITQSEPMRRRIACFWSYFVSRIFLKQSTRVLPEPYQNHGGSQR